VKHLERWRARQSGDETGWGIIVEGTGNGGQKPRWIIYPTPDLDEQDAALIMAAHNAAVENRPGRSVYVNSITNTRLEPIIEIAIGPEVAHLQVREARQHISHLTEAVESSMSDALLCRFIRDHVFGGVDDDGTKAAIGQMLGMNTVTAPIAETGETQ
jgi:hypothetical protein